MSSKIHLNSKFSWLKISLLKLKMKFYYINKHYIEGRVKCFLLSKKIFVYVLFLN